MMNFIGPRWRKPAGTVVAGAVFAAAWAIRGGENWWLFVVLVSVATLARAFMFYQWAGEDDDVAALAGSRADERQKLISLRCRALSLNLVVIGAFIGLTAAVALRAAWWWPFAAMLVLAGLGYMLGFSAYGVAEERPAGNESNAGSPACR